MYLVLIFIDIWKCIIPNSCSIVLIAKLFW
jgi:hypothetical protein